MKLTNKQVQNVIQGLGRVSEDVKARVLRLEVGTSFMVALAKKKLAPYYEALDEERDKLLDECVKHDEKNQRVKIAAKMDGHGNVIYPEQWDLGENEKRYRDGIRELLLSEVEIEGLKPIKLEAFKIKKTKVGDKEEEGEIDPDILFLLTPWLELE